MKRMCPSILFSCFMVLFVVDAEATFGFTDIVFLVLGALSCVGGTPVERVAFAFVRATQDTLKLAASCDMGVASCFV